MRVLEEFDYKGIKATLFIWNEKYLLKLETQWMEQVYKFPQEEILEVGDLKARLESLPMEDFGEVFRAMSKNLKALAYDT